MFLVLELNKVFVNLFKKDGSGVVGLEQQKIAKVPMKFKLREKVAKISSGADHLVFLTVNGEVYTAGNSEHGQLGRVSKYNSFRGGRRGSGKSISNLLHVFFNMRDF